MKSLKRILILVFCPSCLMAQGPVFEWAGEITGERKINSYAIEVDDEGSVITLGYFFGSIDIDPGPATFTLDNLSFPTYPDIFVQKLDSTGNFLWAAQFGGELPDGAWSSSPGQDNANWTGDIKTDDEGNVFITTRFMSDSIDVDPGPDTSYIHSTDPSDNWTADYLIVKLDPEGNYLWGHAFGGKGNERIGRADVDVDGNIYVVGSFQDSVDFDPSPTNEVWLIADGAQAGFVHKLNSEGELVWARKIGGPMGYALPHDMEIGQDGLLYMTGALTDTFDFDLGPGVFELTEYVDTVPLPIFILKLDSEGEFVWAGQLPGGSFYSLIAVNTDGEMAVTSGFNEDVIDIDPSPSGEVLLYDLGLFHWDQYIVKLSAQGEFLYGGHMDLRFLGGFVFDAQGGLMMTVYFNDTVDMDLGPESVIVPLPSAQFPFESASLLSVNRLNEDLTLDWYRIIGSTYPNAGERIDLAIDMAANLYITSGFRGTPHTDLDPSPTETYNPPFGGTFYGNYDVFVLKWSQPDLLVGVADKDNISGFNAYPNPSTGKFTLKLGEVYETVKYSIMDAAGRTLQAGQGQNTAQMDIVVDAVPGLYQCRVHAGSVRATFQLIVQ